MCLAMNKEGSVRTISEVPCGRITRSRAAAHVLKDKDLPPVPSISNPVKKQTKHGISKRAAFDENSHVASYTTLKCKKRAVLKDVSNVCSQNSSRQWKPAGKVQHSAVQRGRLAPSKMKRCSNSKASILAPCGNVPTYNDVEHKMIEEVQKVGLTESKDPCSFAEVSNSLVANNESIRLGESPCTSSLFEENHFSESHEPMNHANNGFVDNAKVKLYDDLEGSSMLDFIDIDTDHTNPQKCCTYASDIYTNLRVAELIWRPIPNYMETLQQDITESMRGILIDWLVEVSEEFKLVPDTLYLTIYMIDRFLSQNCIERRRLQLLGITCMLIASKYEEICTPRVKEFCFITDDTYTIAEVLKMESQVLGSLGFQLSVPTTKTFLRRFLYAAHALDKVPSLALGYMANYLAELTLVEYSFIKFLPSVIAASAVFLARWTMDQSNHPWNSTLEYYTSYKSLDLKEAVLALHELQMNSRGCKLNAVREKYKQDKFENVATLTSPSPLDSLF
ncbi:cyclin-A2-1-like [Canna indica]|uniref:Cyclin-A2-1-like n=1 Tax=Canna indica TaxID=4628 RepID=A0AAQ3JZQ0_9LILI|nr:cyclin-A2-1-like [Canna indica]